MCKPSVISDDWVVKGFHLHVQGIELAVRPGHERGKVVFRSVFSRKPPKAVQSAVEWVHKNCLADAKVKAQWHQTIEKAIDYLSGYNGELAQLARGRMAELTFLKRALLHVS